MISNERENFMSGIPIIGNNQNEKSGYEGMPARDPTSGAEFLENHIKPIEKNKIGNPDMRKCRHGTRLLRAGFLGNLIKPMENDLELNSAENGIANLGTRLLGGDS